MSKGMEGGVSRRSFLKGAGVAAAAVAGSAALAGCASGSTGAASGDWLPKSWDYECDLLVIGYGGAGMWASLIGADECGQEVIVLEKAPVEGGGNSRINNGEWTIVEESDKERFKKYIKAFTHGKTPEPMIDAWVNECVRNTEYADKYGMTYEVSEVALAGAIPEYYFLDDNAYEGSCKLSSVDGFGMLSFRELDAQREKLGVQVLFDCHDERLIQNPETKEIVGAYTMIGSEEKTVKARKGVIMTTGGFEFNEDLKNAYLKCYPFKFEGWQFNTGDGIKAALWAGAVKDITSATMIFDRGLVAPGTTAGYTEESVKAGNPQWPGNGQFNPGTQPFLKVNLRGERFALESADYDYLPHAAAQQPGGVYISVWDGNFGDDVQRFHTLGCSAGTRTGVLGVKKEDGTYDLDKYFEKELADGRLQKADTLDELADKLGFDADAKKTFLATCERYNELYDNQEDVDFGKEPYRLSELRTPPFFGATLGGTLLTTIDGVRINADCQALNTDFEPIEGLYCAGDCSGSLFSGNYPDQMHGVACGRTMTEALHVVKLVAAK